MKSWTRCPNSIQKHLFERISAIGWENPIKCELLKTHNRAIWKRCCLYAVSRAIRFILNYNFRISAEKQFSTFFSKYFSFHHQKWMISVLLLEKINSLHSLFNSKEVLDLYNTYIILIQHVSVSIYPHKKTPNVQRDSEFSGCAADQIVFYTTLYNTNTNIKYFSIVLVWIMYNASAGLFWCFALCLYECLKHFIEVYVSICVCVWIKQFMMYLKLGSKANFFYPLALTPNIYFNL